MKTGDARQFNESMQAVTRKMNDFSRAMKLLGKAVKIANRDIIRATRRPSLIHNGGKP